MADVVEKRPGAEIVSPPLARQDPVYGRRFAVVLLLVMVLFAGMLGFFAYLMSRSDSSKAAFWSSYKPPAGELYESAQSMADYVAPRYVSNGDPIAVVQAQPPIFEQSEVAGIAFMQRPNQGVGTAYRQFEAADNTMMYVFCGPAAGCALPARGEDVTPLLRRESLELALYTFTYWPDINSVVVLLPPDKAAKPAFLFRRKALAAQLSRPLESTLPKRDAITTSSMTEGELATVEALTEDNIFLSSFQQTANRQTILLLGTGNE